MLQGGPNRNPTAKGFFEVGRLPGLARNRVVVDHGGVRQPVGRRVAVVQGRGVDEGLEGAARLAAGLGGPVELAGGEVDPAHQGADRPRGPLQGYQGALEAGALVKGQLVAYGPSGPLRGNDPAFHGLADPEDFFRVRNLGPGHGVNGYEAGLFAHGHHEAVGPYL